MEQAYKNIKRLSSSVSTHPPESMEQSLALDDTHKAWNIGNMAEGNGFPRVDSLIRVALRGTCRVEHLHIIITVLGLSNSIPPLFIHQGCHTSICLLRTFEELISREAQQGLRIDCVLAYERLVIRQSLRCLVDRTLVEDCVRARSTRSAGEEIRGRRAQSEEKGHRAKYAARREWLWLMRW